MSSPLPFTSEIVPECLGLAIATLFYGIFVVLFISNLAVLHRVQRRAYWLNLTATVILFAFATTAVVTDVIYEITTLIDIVENSYHPVRVQLLVVASVIYTLANLITDVLLTHRCYLIWSRRRSIAVFTILLVVADNLILIIFGIARKGGYDFQNASNMQYIRTATATSLCINAFVHFVLTSLIAGRIWWIIRQARLILRPEDCQRYRMVVAIMLESGIIYPLSLIPYAVLLLKYINIFLYPTLVQIAGIAPTLIMVRVGLGVTVENVTPAYATSTTQQPEQVQNDPSQFSVPRFTSVAELSYSDVERLDSTLSPRSCRRNSVSYQTIITE